MACTNCGESGWIMSTYWEKRVVTYDWKGSMVESDISTGETRERKTGNCSECGQIVKIPQQETTND